MGEPHPTYEELKQQLAAAERLISSLKAGAVGTGRPGSGAVEGERDAALHESLRLEADNRYLADLIHNVSDAIYSSDNQYILLSWNKAAEKMYGWRSDEVLGKNIIELTKPTFVNLTPDEFVKSMDKNGFWSGDIIHHRKNGELLHTLATVTTMRDKQGNKLGVVTVIKDISERMKAEEALKMREVFLDNVIENTPSPLWVSDGTGTVIRMNQALRDVLQVTKSEIIGKYNILQDVQVAEQGYMPLVKKVFEEGKTANFTLKYRTGPETRFHPERDVFVTLDIVISAIKDEHGKVTHAICQQKNISDRIAAEQALKEREVFLTSVIDNTPSPLWVSDANGTVIRMNQALRDLLQVTDEEIVGKYNVLKDAQVAEQGYLPQVKKVFQEGKTANFTIKYKTSLETQLDLKWDVSKILEITISAVKDGDGNVTHAICQQIDISDRIAAEKALMESQERFYGAFHYSPSMNIILSQNDMSIVEVNDAFCRVTGYSNEELISSVTMEANLWEDLGQRAAILNELKQKGKVSDREISLRMKNGEIRFFYMNLSVMKSGVEQYLFASMIDITNRKKAEAALLASEKRYRSSLDSMMEGCQIIDYDWRYVYVNDAFLKPGNQKRERFIGHTMMEFNPQLEKTKVYPFIKRCMEERVPTRMEDQFPALDGKMGWFDLSIQPVPEGIFILSLDITERRKMEDRIRYHAGLVESISDAVVSSDIDYKILSWNKAAEELYGWSESDVIGKRIMDVTRSELITETVQEIRDILIKTNHWRGEAVHYRKNGEKLEVLISVSALRDEAGKEIGAVSVFKDITERKNAEMAIHQSEERFRRIFQAGPLGIMLSGMDYTFTMINPRGSEMLGYTEKEIIGMSFKDISFPEDIEVNLPNLEKLKKGQITCYTTEKRYKKKNGDMFWGNLVVTLLRDNEGNPQGFLAMVDDISSRKQAEEKIANLNLVLRAIRNINQLITREKNRDRLIRGICDNLAAGGTFRSAWIILIDEVRQPVSWTSTNITRGIEGVVEAFRMGKLPRCVRKALTQNKVIITVDPDEQCTGCPLSGTNKQGSLTVRLEHGGKVYGFLCGTMRSTSLVDEDEVALFSEVAADISFALRDIELSFSNELLLQEQLRASKLESIGTLAGGIAHDFNNLLTGIMGNIGLAKTLLPNDSPVFGVLDEAEKAANRSRSLTQQLLTFARGGRPIKKVVNITGTIRDSATFALRGSKTKLEISLPDDLWLVEADEGQISQVIHNLVINADEAMPNGGTLSITGVNHHQKRMDNMLVAAGNYVRIDVRDSGVGISPENLPKIYEPYYTTKHQGNGLGLTSAYSIIKNHGGYLLAESVLNQGSVFHIYLPASKKTAKGEQIMAAKKSTQAGGKVLVMDDDEIIRKMLVSMLNLAGYEVEASADGVEAIEKYQQAMSRNDPFSAVIMDLTVPGGMGGKDAVSKLLEIDPDASVIVSSGYATDPIMSEYKKYGFSAVIAKPYSIGQLQETLSGLNLKKK